MIKGDIANYADDITPYLVKTTTDALMYALETDTNLLIKWFQDNYLKLNTDKCHLLVSNHKECVFINAADDIIECEISVKLFRVTIGNKLNFNEHVSIIFKKASQKNCMH